MLTAESLQQIADMDTALPVKLAIEGSEKEVRGLQIDLNECQKSKASSKKSSRSSKDAVRRQRVEELTRFFMEGRAGAELDFGRIEREDDKDGEDNEADTSDTIPEDEAGQDD